MELCPGTVLGGRFVLERRLGEGGMGVVWAARHAVTRKAVAIKLLKPERASDPLVRERFVREARTASKVQHPNIIEIRDVIELEDGAPAIVMDLLDGETLGDLLEREGALPLERVAPLLLQVLSAVGTAHASGVVHRDLKPDNIFLVRVPDGAGDRISVRVLDFGIAKVIAADGGIEVSRGLTNTGALLGTPYYMAPEQLFGERDIDARADVWALGIIFYECLAGRRPTEAENLGQILRIITDDRIVPLATAMPSVPEDVDRLVGRMLVRHREQRLGSLVDAVQVLTAYAGGRDAPLFSAPLSATQPVEPRKPSTRPHAIIPSDGDALPTAATLASTTQSTTSDRLLRNARRAGRALPIAIGTIAVAGVAAILFAVTRGPTVAASPSAAASAVPPSSAPAPSVRSPLPSAFPLVPPTSLAPDPSPAVAPSPSIPSPAHPRPIPPTPPAPSRSSAPVLLPAPSQATPSPYDHL